MINKSGLRYLWLFLVLLILHIDEYISFLYLHYLLASNTHKTNTINPNATQETKINKVFGEIPQPENS
jgi:hypothetical protein